MGRGRSSFGLGVGLIPWTIALFWPDAGVGTSPGARGSPWAGALMDEIGQEAGRVTGQRGLGRSRWLNGVGSLELWSNSGLARLIGLRRHGMRSVQTWIESRAFGKLTRIGATQTDYAWSNSEG